MEPALILLAFVAAFFWVRQPALQPYSLQLTAALFVAYFLGKRLMRAQWHHFFPGGNGNFMETALLVAGTAVLVGHTGALSSPFLPIFFLLMFASVLTLHISSLVVELTGLMIFLWAISAQPWSWHDVITWLSFPLLTPLMIFARWQWEDAQKSQRAAQQTVQELTQQESTTLLFLSTFLKPKLQLVAASLFTARNLEMAQQQIQLLITEVDNTIRELDANSTE
jgi:hypothetical protein